MPLRFRKVSGDLDPPEQLEKSVVGPGADVTTDRGAFGLLKLHAALPGDNMLTIAVLGDTSTPPCALKRCRCCAAPWPKPAVN